MKAVSTPENSAVLKLCAARALSVRFVPPKRTSQRSSSPEIDTKALM